MGAESTNTAEIIMKDNYYLGQLTDALLRNGYTVTCKTVMPEDPDNGAEEIHVFISK